MSLKYPSADPSRYEDPFAGIIQNLPAANYKPPSMNELYQHVFHKALDPEKEEVVESTAKIFFELVKNNVIHPKKEQAKRDDILNRLYL